MTDYGTDKGRALFRQHHTPEGRKERRESDREAGSSLAAGRDLFQAQHPHGADEKTTGLQAGADLFTARKGNSQ